MRSRQKSDPVDACEEETAMKAIMGFPSTMQDDYQLNLINLIRH